MHFLDTKPAASIRSDHLGIPVPRYSPAYPTALTRKGLLPGEVGEVLQELPHSLARCIRQYQLHGAPPVGASAARLDQLHAEAERLALGLGWIDVRELDAQEVDCIIQTCSNPATGRILLQLVLSYAARQGVIPEQALQTFFLDRSNTGNTGKLARQWSEADWKIFRYAHPKGTVERIAAVLMVHLGTSWEELCQMPGDELTARIENQPHPELQDDMGGLDFSSGLQFHDTWEDRPIPNEELHYALVLGSIECSLPFFHENALRQLFYRRAVDCGFALLRCDPGGIGTRLRPAVVH